ncbi:MAG: DUF1080 domain-containing protein [Verrucomicrobiota bacterium]
MVRSFNLLFALAGFSVGFGFAEESHQSAPDAALVAKGDFMTLFDGENLGDWESIEFGGEGDVHVSFDGALTLENGARLTGVVWKGDIDTLPQSNYEITLEAKKHYGDDFFCGLTFPVGESFATLICGGWGGGVVGLSSIDRKDASLNETSQDRSFELEQWYAIRIRVTDEKLSAWIDGEPVFEVDTTGKEISLRPGQIELCTPLGLANYRTRSAFRNIKLQRIDQQHAD